MSDSHATMRARLAIHKCVAPTDQFSRSILEDLVAAGIALRDGDGYRYIPPTPTPFSAVVRAVVVSSIMLLGIVLLLWLFPENRGLGRSAGILVWVAIVGIGSAIWAWLTRQPVDR